MDSQHDSRYLAGIEHFNASEYFDAHEVWEELWMDCPAAERRFYQSLIQAAVALHHFRRGNFPGAVRLFHSGKRYMQPYGPRHHGIEVEEFWLQMEECLAPALTNATASAAYPLIQLEANGPEPDAQG
jgi:predicted metal-dependent hydrolase